MVVEVCVYQYNVSVFTFKLQFKQINFQVSPHNCLEPVPRVQLLGVVHLQLGRTPVALFSLPQLLHPLVDCEACLPLCVEATELESRQEVLPDILCSHSSVGGDHPLHVPPAGAQNVPLLHVLTYISEIISSLVLHFPDMDISTIYQLMYCRK